MILKISLGIVALVAVFLFIAALQTDQLYVSRRIHVAAPSSIVFAHVNNLRKWKTWNPWGRVDPAMRESWDDAQEGVGAVYSWSGDNKVGAGRMTIIESRPPELVRIKLEFLKPIAGTNTAEFTFQHEGEQTAVAWTMTGKKNLFSKAIGLVIGMDRMIGGQFEQGLADLNPSRVHSPKFASHFQFQI